MWILSLFFDIGWGRFVSFGTFVSAAVNNRWWPASPCSDPHLQGFTGLCFAESILDLVRWVMIALARPYDGSSCILVTSVLIGMLPPINLYFSLASLLACTCQCVSIWSWYLSFPTPVLMSHYDLRRETGVSGLFSCWLWTRRLSHRGKTISKRFVGKKDVQNFGSRCIVGEYVGHPVAFLKHIVFFMHDQFWC